MKQELFEPGFYYHVFNRGNNREDIFKEDDNYIYFLELAKKYLTETCNIYAYCLLPNHFHILLSFKNRDELPDIYKQGKSKISQPLSNMFNAYAKAINKGYKRTGSLFQKHLHRIKIDSEDYFRSLVLYVHLNPEKHKIYEDFSEYEYSSYLSYCSEGKTLLKRNEVYDYFGGKDNLIFCHKQRKLNLDVLKDIEELDF